VSEVDMLASNRTTCTKVQGVRNFRTPLGIVWVFWRLSVYQGISFLMPFFLLLDSFWVVGAAVVPSAGLSVAAVASVGGAAAAAVLSIGVSGVTTELPLVAVAAGGSVVAGALVAAGSVVAVASVAAVASVFAAPSPEAPEVEVTSSALPPEAALPSGAGSPGRTFSTTALLPGPVVIARLAAFEPPVRTSVPESVSGSGSMLGVPLWAAM